MPTTLRLMIKLRSNISLALLCCPRRLYKTPRLLQAASCVRQRPKSTRTFRFRELIFSDATIHAFAEPHFFIQSSLALALSFSFVLYYLVFASDKVAMEGARRHYVPRWAQSSRPSKHSMARALGCVYRLLAVSMDLDINDLGINKNWMFNDFQRLPKNAFRMAKRACDLPSSVSCTHKSYDILHEPG